MRELSPPRRASGPALGGLVYKTDRYSQHRLREVNAVLDRLQREPDRQSARDGVGAEYDSICARLLECHAADGEGLRYRFRDRKIAARCPGVPATRSNAR